MTATTITDGGFIAHYVNVTLTDWFDQFGSRQFTAQDLLPLVQQNANEAEGFALELDMETLENRLNCLVEWKHLKSEVKDDNYTYFWVKKREEVDGSRPQGPEGTEDLSDEDFGV